MKQWIESRGFFSGVILTLIIILILVIACTIIFKTGVPTFSDFKEIGESIKVNVEWVAIIVGGLWAYRLFVKNRKEFPYATIEHNIEYWYLEDGKIYLTMIVTVKNSGEVRLPLTSGIISVQQVLPLHSHIRWPLREANEDNLKDGKVKNLFITEDRQAGMEIDWPEIGYRSLVWPKGDIQLEPGESEELQFDFILENTIQTVKIVSYIENKYRKQKSGWTKTTMFNFRRRL